MQLSYGSTNESRENQNLFTCRSSIPTTADRSTMRHSLVVVHRETNGADAGNADALVRITA